MNKIELKLEFADAAPATALVPALTYAGARTVANILTAIAPRSATLALVTALIWLAGAAFVFVIMTWFRDDNWLAAGVIIGITFLVGGLFADFVGRVVAGSFGDAAFATGGAALGLMLRAIIIVPLAGGAVAGARWLTTEISRSEAW